MLFIENFSKRYGKSPDAPYAVRDLSLHAEAGDIYGFIGHNGAGKTTTLRSIAGALDFTEGDIRVDGHSIRKEPVLCKQRIGYIPDNPDLYEHMTGMQYLWFFADVFDIPRTQAIKEIQRYLEAFELNKVGDLISSYSHGMKQKLAIISALLHHPKLYLLDEPFVGLDPKAAHITKSFMAEECANGSTFFFSTHVLEVAEKLCNKIAIIKGGRLVASGLTEEVKGNGSLEDVFLELTDHE